MFERKPLRTDVAAEIQGRIIDGRLPAGARINESTLAEDLGISRTPLREAMLCLETEGVLTSDMGRGFQIPPLTGGELQDILGALAVVMPAALRASEDGGLKDQFEAANLLNRARMQTDEPALFCEHLYLLLRGLIAGCYNDILRRESLRLVRRLLRYLHGGLQRGLSPAAILNRLEAVLGALGRQDRVAAAAGLGELFGDMSRELAPVFSPEAAGEA